MTEALNLQQIPKKSGIYYICDKQKHLIYIGESSNIYDRIRTHEKWPLINSYTKRRHCGLRVFYELADETLRKKWEKIQIKKYTPPLNKEYI